MLLARLGRHVYMYLQTPQNTYQQVHGQHQPVHQAHTATAADHPPKSNDPHCCSNTLLLLLLQ
jgi:hypothetical protein